MDMLSNPLPPPKRTNQWPNVPAEKGKFYGVQDPVFRKDQLCVMTMETWADVGTIIEHQKRVMKAQDETIKKLQAAHGALAAQLNDMQERYSNLRDAYRAMKGEQLKKENPGMFESDGGTPPSFL